MSHAFHPPRMMWFSTRARVAAGRVRRREAPLGASRFARAHLVRFDTPARSRGTCLARGKVCPARARACRVLVPLVYRPKTHNLHRPKSSQSVPDLADKRRDPPSEERAGRRGPQHRARACVGGGCPRPSSRAGRSRGRIPDRSRRGRAPTEETLFLSLSGRGRLATARRDGGGHRVEALRHGDDLPGLGRR